MIKLKAEIANRKMNTDCEVYGSGSEVIVELAAIMHQVVYDITNSREEFAAYAAYLAAMLNNTDYKAIKETFDNGIQRQSD